MTVWYCIPPENYLFMMADWETHMVIAPHLLHSEKYKAFYKKNKDLYTMLDNGLWEGEVVSNTKLLSLAREIGANEIIAPDHVSGKITINRTEKFLDFLGAERWNYKIHGAIHGKDYKEQLECLQKLLELDVDVIDMPKMLGPINRENLWQYLVRNSTTPVHFLGYYKEEWDMLKNSLKIRSFDTSVPFKPKYTEKFQLDLPFTRWNYWRFKFRTNKWRKMFKY